MRFKAQVTLDSDLVFATHAEATEYARVSLDVLQPLAAWRIVTTDQPVTHRMTVSGAEPIGSQSFAVVVSDRDSQTFRSGLTFTTYREAGHYGRSLVGRQVMFLTPTAPTAVSVTQFRVIETELPATARITAAGALEYL